MKNRNKSNHQVGFSVSWTKPKPMTTQVSIYKRLSIAPKIIYNFVTIQKMIFCDLDFLTQLLNDKMILNGPKIFLRPNTYQYYEM